MSDIQPGQYARRILLVVSGMSPQILTETLYALIHATSERKFVPTEIHLVTTRQGAQQARLSLLSGDAHFLRLCADYAFDPASFDESAIHVITEGGGQELDDIRTPEQNEATADFITTMISHLSADDDSALHVSMAGGRKTMGYYAGYALSLYGRAQDRLSHVLVSAGYEGLPQFYYPTPNSRTVYDRDGRALDAAAAQVTLAEIPFVRLRAGVPPRLLRGRARFSEAIALVQNAEQAPCLIVDVANRQLLCNGEPAQLPAILFAFYVWMLERESAVARREMDDDHTAHELAQELLKVYQRIEGEMRDTDRTADSLSRHGIDKAYFEEKKSRIGKALRDQLGQALARPFEIKAFGSRGATQYGLSLEPEQVEWTTQQDRGE